MDSAVGGAQGGQGARARRRPSRIIAREVRGERKKARRSGPCGAGASVGQKEKRPGFLQGAVSLFSRYFIALARLDDGVTIWLSRWAGAGESLRHEIP